MNEFISENIQDNILRVTLNNPSTQNTLSLDMIRRLQTVFENADKNHDIKDIILASSGKIFCAGHNLTEMNNHSSDPDKGLGFFTILINSCSELMLTILHNSKPVIAEVNGVATAAGCQLVASCDLAYASTNAKFATPGVNIGLFCSTPMVALSRAVKNKHSMEMLLTGDLIKAEKAIEIGLINNIFINKDLTKDVNLIAELISKKSSLTLKVGKKAFYEQSGMKIVEAYKYASEVMIKNMMEVESEEGISSFIEKRKPNWD